MAQVTDPQAEHDRALRDALLGPDDPAALDAALAREAPRRGAFAMPARGDDPEQHVPAVPSSHEERLIVAGIFSAISEMVGQGHQPHAVILPPERFEGATMIAGLPIKRGWVEGSEFGLLPEEEIG